MLKVEVDEALKKRWLQALQQLEASTEQGAEALDEKYEVLGNILENTPPLYLAGGFKTARAFLAKHVNEDERTVRRMVRVARPPREDRSGGTAPHPRGAAGPHPGGPRENLDLFAGETAAKDELEQWRRDQAHMEKRLTEIDAEVRTQPEQLERHDEVAGDWEAWLSFFLRGVEQTAENAHATARKALDLFKQHEDDIRREVRGSSALSALALHHQLKNKPISTAKTLGAAARLSAPTTNRAFERLVELGIAREVTGKKRSRVYAYQPLIDLLQADLPG